MHQIKYQNLPVRTFWEVHAHLCTERSSTEITKEKSPVSQVSDVLCSQYTRHPSPLANNGTLPQVILHHFNACQVCSQRWNHSIWGAYCNLPLVPIYPENYKTGLEDTWVMFWGREFEAEAQILPLKKRSDWLQRGFQGKPCDDWIGEGGKYLQHKTVSTIMPGFAKKRKKKIKR